ncbi:MAG: serine/threonine-protein kinase [Candidatus Sumerlaeia bacterium]|nr:serine/threonine-protein kinase [Candidatus Sumerlaeia bacterium]
MLESPRASLNPGKTALLQRPSERETVAQEAGAAPARSPSATGTEAGSPVELREQIAQGGFGEVWTAVQVSLSRTVAVKRLREDLRLRARSKGLDIDELEEDFRREGLTAARLDHPNILPIYDLTGDARGRPMMAMKLVRGESWHLDMVADFPKLQPREFLAKHLPILIAVSQAVAFAHSRGVVHRDLKPAQVMVGEFGEALLMDWGLAILFDPAAFQEASRSERAINASTRQSAPNPAGTPAFMAPEQTEPSAENIGPWTDVYLLGGMLYYLLTGTAPHDAPNSKIAFEKARRGVPEHPSERMPGREMPEELVAITLRAMRPKPEDRHSSAKAFISALNDHLAGTGRRRESELLTGEAAAAASRAPLQYSDYSSILVQLEKARRLWAENPSVPRLEAEIRKQFARLALGNSDLTLARAQVAGLADGDDRSQLLRGIGAAESRLRQRERQRKVGIAASALLFLVVAATAVRLRFALATIDAKNEALTAQIARAEAARGDAEELMNLMLVKVQPELSRASGLGVLAEVGDLALAYFDRIAAEDRSEGTKVRHALALRQVGEILASQGNLAEALRILEQSLAIRQQKASAGSPADPDEDRNLAITQELIGRIHARQGALDEAMTWLQRSTAIRTRMKELHPDSADAAVELAGSLQQIGHVQWQQGDLRGALASYRGQADLMGEAIGIAPDAVNHLYGYSSALNNVGDALLQLGDLAAALVDYRNAQALAKQVNAASPEDSMYRHNVAVSSAKVGDVLWYQGDYAGALEEYTQAVAISEELTRRDPLNVNWRRSTAIYYQSIGDTHDSSGDPEKALEALRRSLEERRRLTELSNSPEYRSDYLTSLSRIGGLLYNNGKPGEALELFSEALAIAESLERESGEGVRRKRDVALARKDVGRAFRALGEFDKSEQALKTSAATLSALIASNGDDTSLRQELGVVQQSLGMTYAAAGRPREAAIAYKAGLSAIRSLFELEPDNAKRRLDYLLMSAIIGEFAASAAPDSSVLAAVIDAEAAAAAARDALTLAEVDVWRRLALARCLLLHKMGRPAESCERLRQILEDNLIDPAVANEFDTFVELQNLAPECLGDEVGDRAPR